MPAADDLSKIDREMWLREREKREYAERALMVEAESYSINLSIAESDRRAALSERDTWKRAAVIWCILFFASTLVNAFLVRR